MDNLLIIEPTDYNASINLTKKLKKKFKLINLDFCNYFFGVKITRNFENE